MARMDEYALMESAQGGSDANAKTAAMLGIMSMAIGMTICCSSLMGALISGILGAIAVVMARSCLAENPVGEAKAYATVGLYSGMVSAVWAGLITVGMVLYLVFIFGFVLLSASM